MEHIEQQPATTIEIGDDVPEVIKKAIHDVVKDYRGIVISTQSYIDNVCRLTLKMQDNGDITNKTLETITSQIQSMLSNESFYVVAQNSPTYNISIEKVPPPEINFDKTQPDA